MEPAHGKSYRVNIDKELKRLEPYLLDRTERKLTEARQSRKTSSSSFRKSSRLGVRRFIRSQIHLLTFIIVHFIFSLFIRLRQAYHMVVDHVVSVFAHHHSTPELIQRDVKNFSKLPYHLSVILKLEDQGRGAGLETLVNEVSDIAAWCACSGIPLLSIYEKTGTLKSFLPETHRAVSRRLSLYLGSRKPGLSLSAPHLPCISTRSANLPSTPGSDGSVSCLQVVLLSEEDGRDSIVDLTKTLAEMSQHGKLAPRDISVDVVDAELRESVVGEPDLLIIFGPYPDLIGYPPWQLRLTEIYCMKDNNGVGYQVFLKGLRKFAGAEMRLGR